LNVAASDGFIEGFLDDYFAECDEHLAAATRALLLLETTIGAPSAERAAIDELFRIFHSLKGISAMVELRPAEQLAHEVEHYLRAIRDREAALTPAGIEVLLQATQRLEDVIAARRFGRPMPSIVDAAARVAAMAATQATPEPLARGVDDAAATRDPAEGAATWICTFTPTRELLAQGIGVDAMRRRLTEIGAIVEAAPQVRSDGTIAFEFTLRTAGDVDAAAALRASPMVVSRADRAAAPAVLPAAPRPEGAEEVPPAAVSPSHVVRVDLTRLDELMRTVGDLVISRARLSDALDRVEKHVPPAEWRAAQENAGAIDRQVRMLREGIMRVRLVPIGEIFRRMPLVVRDLARDTGKKVLLDLKGQSTEIDKFLIERMMDPVLHLVRNAVSHGLETPDERVRLGKRPEGTITLAAATAGEMVTIEVADDGRGVDAAAVAARARADGRRVADDVLDRAELLELLCAPGLSTRDATDRASGRGVGMTVVKDTVEQLSGTMALETDPGRGTRFTIQLPLTLAIADALIGRVGREQFAVPQAAVREVVEVSSADVRVIEGHEIVPYRGASLPIIRLARAFGIDGAPGDRFHMFVVGGGSLAAVGLGVDRIVGQREIVVRAIADPLVRVDGVAGATDLGDGRAVLILDPVALVRAQRTAGAGARRKVIGG
jgi:two-component system chemotaxis sensor kinase CheA